MSCQNERKLLKCDQCLSKYKTVKSLNIHKSRSHNSKSTIECPEMCGAFLTSQSSLKKHMITHLPRNLWPHQCPLCKKRFQAKADVSVHLKTKIHQSEYESIVSEKDFDILFKKIDETIAEANKILSPFNLAVH